MMLRCALVAGLHVARAPQVAGEEVVTARGREGGRRIGALRPTYAKKSHHAGTDVRLRDLDERAIGEGLARFRA